MFLERVETTKIFEPKSGIEVSKLVSSQADIAKLVKL